MRYATCHPDRKYRAKGLCNNCYCKDWLDRGDNRAKHAITTQKNYYRYREEMFDALGHVCACCKEADKVFLSLHHVEGNGNQHRLEVGGAKEANFAALLAARREGWPKNKYAVLCMNCQFGERQPGGCPHKRVN
jgi:hypothetical protein